MTGEMAILGKEGDTRISWNSDNPKEVETARETFNRYAKEKKFAAFSVDKKGDISTKLTEFVPELKKIIFVPPIAGGGK